MNERLLTIRQVSEYSMLAPQTIRRLIADGRIPAIHIGRSVRILESEFLDWLKTCRVFPRPSRQKAAM